MGSNSASSGPFYLSRSYRLLAEVPHLGLSQSVFRRLAKSSWISSNCFFFPKNSCVLKPVLLLRQFALLPVETFFKSATAGATPSGALLMQGHRYEATTRS